MRSPTMVLPLSGLPLSGGVDGWELVGVLGLGCCFLVVARAGAGRGARAEGVKRASLVTRLAVRGRGRFGITIEVSIVTS